MPRDKNWQGIRCGSNGSKSGDMKSMLILTDFSEAAFRAAEYGCGLAGALHVQRIVLYHAYQTMMAITDIPVGTTVDTPVNDQQIYLENMESMGLLQDRLKSMVQPPVTIDLLAEDVAFVSLADMVNQRCREEGIEVIVMGVSGNSRLEKVFLGSTTAEILRTTEYPVLIVPQETPLGKKIKTIVFTSDLKDVDAIPSFQLHNFLDDLGGRLCVVNVARKPTENYSAEMEKSIADLHDLLKKYAPSFHYITGDDIVQEILSFAEKQGASLIMAVHQKHGFWSGLFHESVTKKLAFNPRIPLLSLPTLE